MPTIRKQLPNSKILLKQRLITKEHLRTKHTLPNKLPKIGPVQENETITKVNAIKKIPMIPPASSAFEIYWQPNLVM
jgi:hypothetical protein